MTRKPKYAEGGERRRFPIQAALYSRNGIEYIIPCKESDIEFIKSLWNTHPGNKVRVRRTPTSRHKAWLIRGKFYDGRWMIHSLYFEHECIAGLMGFWWSRRNRDRFRFEYKPGYGQQYLPLPDPKVVIDWVKWRARLKEEAKGYKIPPPSAKDEPF